MFLRPDWTLFRTLGTLGQKAGVPQDRLASLVLKELTDNALDAGANVRIAPTSRGFAVIDDGPGIAGDDVEIASLFSIGRPLTSSKLLRLPTRGAMGNGLRVVAGAVLASGGELIVQTRGRRLHLTPQPSGTTDVRRGDKGLPMGGTRIEITFGPALRGQARPEEMSEAAIALRGETRFEGRSSPWWYDSDSFHELFLAADGAFALDVLRMLDTPKNFERLPAFRGAVGLRSALATRMDTDEWLGALREAKSAPPATKLGVAGEGALECHGYAKKTGEMRLAPAVGAHSARIPVVVEVWASRLPDDSTSDATIYVNRTPITAEVRCFEHKGREGKVGIAGCGLNHWFKTGKSPMDLHICVTSPFMPITTDGKEPNLRPILATLVDAISSAVRKAKSATSEGRKMSQRNVIEWVLPKAMRKASGQEEGATHRFSLRQLYYAVRPLLAQYGLDPNALDYGHFSKVVGQIEAEQGQDLPGMYRDARGTLYHPHTGEAIALGTLNVEKYRRPEYRFNKVIYIEKAGFVPLLQDVAWMERHDCAILTSQGQATRAVKDVLDLLGDTSEPIEFFCIHDADGYGTLIYEALVEGTQARPGRRVKVTNLGLDPWEAKEMGLEVETFEKGGRDVPVAEYVRTRRWRTDDDTDWGDFLQTNRYELNAMSSTRFLAWLDAKMAEHAQHAKVVPPQQVLAGHFDAAARERIREALIAEAVRTCGVEERVDILMRAVRPPDNLEEQVRGHLEGRPAHAWEAPLGQLAAKAAREMTEEGR